MKAEAEGREDGRFEACGLDGCQQGWISTPGTVGRACSCWARRLGQDVDRALRRAVAAPTRLA